MKKLSEVKIGDRIVVGDSRSIVNGVPTKFKKIVVTHVRQAGETGITFVDGRTVWGDFGFTSGLSTREVDTWESGPVATWQTDLEKASAVRREAEAEYAAHPTRENLKDAQKAADAEMAEFTIGFDRRQALRAAEAAAIESASAAAAAATVDTTYDAESLWAGLLVRVERGEITRKEADAYYHAKYPYQAPRPEKPVEREGYAIEWTEADEFGPARWIYCLGGECEGHI